MLALDAEGRPPNDDERQILARWAGWGALAQIFDDRNDKPTVREQRAQLEGLLTPGQLAAARRSTLNAHYTDAEIAVAIWQLVVGLGFDGGRVLEPGCGAGVFLATQPVHLQIAAIGIELEPISARIAALLQPDADIRNEGFESTRLPAPVDLVVGNVPFGKVALHDPVHNRSRHSIHNHFLIKALHLTRPGGLLAALTSRYTLDAQNPAARRELESLADFAGAIRLPSGAHHAAAGTDVVTDLVVFRRRPEDTPPNHLGSWQTTRPFEAGDTACTVNEWFVSNPELIIGTLTPTGGIYREDDITIALDEPLSPRLRATLDRLARRVCEAGLRYQPPGRAPQSKPTSHEVATSATVAGGKEGSIHRRGGAFVRIVNGAAVSYEPTPRRDGPELAELCALRDTTVALLDVQTRSLDDDSYRSLQADLNERYDRYVGRYGPLNRYQLARTGRTDSQTGDDLYRRLYPRMGGFPIDPDYFTLLALEEFDPDTQKATKADIFRRRVLSPAIARYGADTADDALVISLDEKGRVDIERIAHLLGTSVEHATNQLAGRIYKDPQTGQYLTAEQYLAGDVRARLEAARAAAAIDPAFQANAEALATVLPPDLSPGDIDARLGAPWIPAQDVEAFCSSILDCHDIDVENAAVTATWAISAPTWSRRTVSATSEWGTSRADAIALIEASLNQRPATVYDTLEDGSRVVNPSETFAAREKQEALEARFAEWVWADDERASRLTAIYNRLYNSTVLPAYNGAHLTLPGLSSAFSPHPHQRDAVWRIVSEGDTLLAHAVGAGKTATMVMAAMEQRRLGLINKPAFVVPNHMLGQFACELLQLYPTARLLVARRDDASPAGRKQFVARCATGDWDAVVLTHSSFERIPVSSTTRAEFLSQRMDEFRAAIAESHAGKGLTVKRLEVMLARLEARHRDLAAAHTKDDGATFEQTGIDFVFVDEAHVFKNKPFPTRIHGVGGTGSQRAEDLDVKLWWLRRRNPTRVACFATATPIANSIAELFVAQTYLQPGDLKSARIDSFDAWAATFAATVAALELAPDGGSYRLTNRLARFRNVPELVTMTRQVIDVRTADQLDLPVPRLRGGRAETVVVAPSPQLREYVATLVDRAQAVRDRRVPPEEDNMLKVTGDGRKAALDLRLVGEPPAPGGGKLAAAADRIASIHHEYAARPYHDAAGHPSARAGALQFVFCDQGTPHPGRWSVYEHLKALLVARGVPAERIRFIHDATNDRAKADLFAGCRDGRVSVLIGSTEKMGVGTNAQDRAVALHHLDCPWRPADLEQREGRIRRQGNQNAEIEIIRYVTEGSFDIFMWQTVERKAAFIAQVMHGGTVAREIDDVGDQALSYAEVKALATGNPHIVEKAGVDAEIAKLTRLRAAHERDQAALARTHASAAARVERLEREAAALREAIERRIDTRGDRFTATIDGVRFNSRADAGSRLHQVLLGGDESVVGNLGGFELVGRTDEANGIVELTLAPSPIRMEIDLGELPGLDPARLFQRLENRIARLDRDLQEAVDGVAAARRELEISTKRLGRPFEHASRLASLLRRQGELERQLTPEAPSVSPVASMVEAVQQKPPQHVRMR